MVFNVSIDGDQLLALQEGGGLKKDTLVDRERDWKNFLKYFEVLEPNKSIVTFLKDVDGKVKLEKVIGNYFFTLRVTAADDKTEKYPKKNTALKIRSNQEKIVK